MQQSAQFSTGVKDTLGGRMAANSNMLRSSAIQAGVLQVVTTGVTKTLGAIDAVRKINADESLSEKEKSKAKGGAIGDAVGTTVGTGLGVAAGALLAGKIGAMVGTAIAPGIGTAVGGAIGMAGGALVGWLGGKLGKKAGEAIGGAFGKDEIPAGEAVKEEIATVEPMPQTPLTAELTGNAVMDVNVNLSGDKAQAQAKMRSNSTPFLYNTGRVAESREAFYRSSGQSECGLLAANLEIRYFPMSRKAYENSKASR